MRLTVCLSAVIVGFAVSSSVGAAAGSHVRSELSGFQLEAPPGWVRVASRDIAQTAALRTTGGRPGVEFAFQPATAGRALSYPYAIVTVVPYGAFGLDRQVTEEEMQQIALQIGDRRPTPGHTPASEPGIPEPGHQRPQLLAGRHMAEMAYGVDVPRVGRVESRSACFFGREAMVQITFSARAESMASVAGLCDRLFESFHFDADREYVQSLGAGIIEEESALLAGSVPQAAALGGVALGLVFYAVSRRRPVSDEPECEPQPALEVE